MKGGMMPMGGPMFGGMYPFPPNMHYRGHGGEMGRGRPGGGGPPAPRPVPKHVQAARDKARAIQDGNVQPDERADPRSVEQYNDLDSAGDLQEEAPLEYRLL